MADESKGSLGLDKHVVKLEQFFLAQAGFLRQAAKTTGYRSDVLLPVLRAIYNTCHGIALVARHHLVNEAVMLARALIERTVTAGYLMVSAEEEVRRFESYSKQKSFRKLNRELRAGAFGVQMKFLPEIDKSRVPGLDEALAEFTSERGREITRWSPTTLLDRIGTISERNATSAQAFLLATLLYYEDASEALHGTLYGCDFHLGIYQPGITFQSDEDIVRHLLGQSGGVFWLCGGVIYGLIQLFGDDVEDIRKSSRECIDEMISVLKGLSIEGPDGSAV